MGTAVNSSRWLGSIALNSPGSRGTVPEGQTGWGTVRGTSTGITCKFMQGGCLLTEAKACAVALASCVACCLACWSAWLLTSGDRSNCKQSHSVITAGVHGKSVRSYWQALLRVRLNIFMTRSKGRGGSTALSLTVS